MFVTSTVNLKDNIKFEINFYSKFNKIIIISCIHLTLTPRKKINRYFEI